MGTNYDNEQKYYDNFFSLPLLNTILTQRQLILQAFFQILQIFFTLYSYPSNQILAVARQPSKFVPTHVLSLAEGNVEGSFPHPLTN